MPSSLIAGYILEGLEIGAASWAGTAITFAVRLVTTYAIASLLFKNQGGNNPQGTEVQLGPATDNKLPVVYGNRYAKPIVTDAIISTDQQWMWYVLSFSEATPVYPGIEETSFGDIYYDGKLLIFDPNNPSEITGWYTQPKRNSKVGGQYNTKAAGKLSMWFYRNGSLSTGTNHNCYDMIDQGSNNFDIGTQYQGTTDIDAITLLQDNSTGGGIPLDTQWTTSTQMTNAVFAVLRLHYDQSSGIYGLGGMDAKIQNGLYEPGYAIYDYLVNNSYGCGIPMANINITSLMELNSISTQTLTILDTQGTTVTNTWTYQINGIVDTTQDCLTNLNNMTDACDSWLQWDERIGQWGVIPNISLAQQYQLNNPGTSLAQAITLSTASMRVINSNQIIGGVNLTPTDLKTSINKITVAFPNDEIINQVDYRYYFLEDQFKSPNEPENNVDINMPFVTNSIQGTYLGYRKLWMSREDLIINFSMDYSGIGINAGDIVAIQHEWYGWEPGSYNGIYCPGKPFRISQVKESKDSSGFLGVQITAMGYNDSIYYTMNPHFFTPDQFGLAIDTHNIAKPLPPYITDSYLYETVPAFGFVTTMELWVSATTDPNDYQYIASIFAGAGTFMSPGTVISWDLNQYPSYTGYMIARARGPNTVSAFSDPAAIAWTNNSTVGNATNAVDATNAANVAITPASGTHYLTQSGNTSGNNAQYASSNLSYNASTNNLSTPSISLSSAAHLTPLSSAPGNLTAGTMAMAAANASWGGKTTSTTYLTYYNGSNWVPL